MISGVSRRRVEWIDTDAAGHHHHSAILRWVEAAEADLLRAHGIDWLFGRTPRVRHEVDYRARLLFGDEVTTRISVSDLGRTSLTWAFEVRRGEELAAVGRLVVVYAPTLEHRATPWPDEVRAALSSPGQPDGTEPARTREHASGSPPGR